jgi:hypothetical protein
MLYPALLELMQAGGRIGKTMQKLPSLSRMTRKPQKKDFLHRPRAAGFGVARGESSPRDIIAAV